MRILEITSELDGGGVDRLLYDYCSRMVNDIKFDFVVTSKIEGILENPLKELGCNVYHISQIREGLKKHNKELKRILTDNHYDIIHDHSGYKAWSNLRVAKKSGVGVRIAHSHQSFMAETEKQKIIRMISTPITKMYSTDLFACGNDAAKWMWGKRAFNKGKVYIMKNAIEAARFGFSQEKRDRIREEFNISDKFVVGNVARLSYQKNHEFLINIFAEIKKQRQDAILMLIGRGELEEDIKKQVKELGLDDAVLFMGVRNDVPDLLNAMDVFVLPSRFEGLPVTLVEVQANGLPAVISESVTKEMTISSDFSFISLSQPASKWAKVIYETKRSNSLNIIENTDYDLKISADELRKKYISID